MSAATATIAPENGCDAAPKPSGCNLLRLDGRSRLAKRIGELKALYADAVGSERAITPVIAVRIEDAATLQAIAELGRQRFINGEMTAEDLIRVENRASRAEKALGIGRQPQSSAAPDLRTYLASRSAAA